MSADARDDRTAYLAHLAYARGSRLATFDQALAKLRPDVVELVPVS